MSTTIDSGATSDKLTVDGTGKSAYLTLYESTGMEMSHVDHTIGGDLTSTSDGLPIVTSSNEKPLVLSATGDSVLSVGSRTLLLYDDFEGAAVNTNKWIQTNTTMTQTQVAGLLTLNAGSSVATSVGAMITSHRFMLPTHRAGLVFRCRARHTTHFPYTVIEHGFGTPSTAIISTSGNGAFWRKLGSGQYVPVVSINNSEIFGTPIDNNTFEDKIKNNEYAIFEVNIKGRKCCFSIFKVSGDLVSYQCLELAPTSTAFSTTRLQAMSRIYNLAATTVAVQVLLQSVSVWSIDNDPNKPYCDVSAGMSYGIATSPTAYTQLGVYANNAAPGTSTPNNTATPGATAIQGLSAWNNAGTSFGASDTLDLVIYGPLSAVSSVYGMVIKGIRVDSVSLAAASNAAVYTIQWFLAINSSLFSLATGNPYPPRRKILGYQTLVGSAAIGTKLTPEIDIRFGSGLYVFPNRFLIIGARVIGASVGTLNQVIRTTVDIDGYFE